MCHRNRDNVFVAVGRTRESVTAMQVIYDGEEYNWPIVFHKEDPKALADVVINGSDPWTTMLRRKALESMYGSR